MSNHSKAAKAARKMQKETGRSYCDCLQVVREKFAKEKEIREAAAGPAEREKSELEK